MDHDELRHDPVLGAVLGRLEARRRDCAPLKSTLNRLEHAPAGAHRYRRIDAAAIEALFVDLFLDAHEDAPECGWCSISTPPTTRCTAVRRAASSTAITIAICRSTSSGREAEARQHRCQRRGGRGGGADRRANPRPLGRDRAAC